METWVTGWQEKHIKVHFGSLYILLKMKANDTPFLVFSPSAFSFKLRISLGSHFQKIIPIYSYYLKQQPPPNSPPTHSNLQTPKAPPSPSPHSHWAPVQPNPTATQSSVNTSRIRRLIQPPQIEPAPIKFTASSSFCYGRSGSLKVGITLAHLVLP